MKSNVLTIANKFSFRDVKDYEEKSDRFSSRGRQKLQLKQVLSLISFPLSLSLMRIGEAKWRGIRKYICRDGFIRGGFDSLMAFVPLPREISNRAEICRCKTETYSAISCNNDNAPISRQPSPPSRPIIRVWISSTRKNRDSASRYRWIRLHRHVSRF